MKGCLRLSLGTLAVLLATGALAGKAGAVERESETLFLTANSQNTASVSCPAGQHVLGGGVSTQAGFEKVVVVGTRPADGTDFDSKLDDGWTAVVDAGATADAPAMIDTAICHDGVPASKLRYREVDRAVPAHSHRTKIVRCPDGYQVTGGGVTGEGTFNSVNVEISRPVSRGTAWEGGVHNFSASSKPMTVYGVCVTGGFARSLVYRRAGTTALSGDDMGLGADCPTASPATPFGEAVVGGGALVKPSAAGLLTATTPAQYAEGDTWYTSVDAPDSDVPFKSYAVCRT